VAAFIFFLELIRFKIFGTKNLFEFKGKQVKSTAVEIDASRREIILVAGSDKLEEGVCSFFLKFFRRKKLNQILSASYLKLNMLY